MSSSIEKLKRKRTKRENYSTFCSTPVTENPNISSSISISGIDTNSSSGTNRQSQRHVLLKNLRKVPAKKRKLRQNKENDQKVKKKAKRKRSFVQIDSNKDWETCDESLGHSSIRKTTSESEDQLFLFRDIESPDRIREAPRFIEEYLESPILGFRRREVESPEKINFEKEKRTLPVKELQVRCDDSDGDEDPFILKKSDTLKTYSRYTNKKEKEDEARIEKRPNLLINTPISTSYSNLLWDNFVKDNYEKVAKYLKPPEKNENDKDTSSEEEENHEQTKSKLESFNTKYPKNMNVTRGCWNKSLKKWDRVYVRDANVYNFSGCEDSEFETNNNTEGKMTLNQYCEKRRALKIRNKRKTDDREDDCKEQILCKRKNKPTIKSIETLNMVKFIKDKQNWKNVKLV